MLEKRALEVRFIPISCATPLLYAKAGGFFERNGLAVNLAPAPGWSAIKEVLVYGKADAAHMLCPMPLASSLGIDGRPADLRLGLVQNVNGQALTLARRHAGVADGRAMKGFVLGVPYRFSMQFYLLCDFLAKHGVDPLADVVIEEVAPPLLPLYLREGRLDGFWAPEPYNEIAVREGIGVVHAFSSQLWPGHPCCAIAFTRSFVEERPATCEALMRSVIEAQRVLHAAGPEARAAAAREISGLAGWTGARMEAATRVLAGEHLDEQGATRRVAARIDFIPHPFREYGVWILSQMQRWGQLRRPVDYERVVRDVFLTETARALAEEVGFPGAAPNVAGVAPIAGPEVLATIRSQPFCALHLEPAPARRYDLPEATRLRLSAMLDWLADVAAGDPKRPLEITSDDEVGWLEQMLDETVRNAQFLRETLRERLWLEEHASRQEAIIAAQEALIDKLSTPIVPVLPGVLVLPLIGPVDEARARRVMDALLAEVSRAGAEMVLIDVTGVPSMNAAVVLHLIRIAQAAALLGARCIFVGVRADLAMELVQQGPDLPALEVERDLRRGIERALQDKARRGVER